MEGTSRRPAKRQRDGTGIDHDPAAIVLNHPQAVVRRSRAHPHAHQLVPGSHRLDVVRWRMHPPASVDEPTEVFYPGPSVVIMDAAAAGTRGDQPDHERPKVGAVHRNQEVIWGWVKHGSGCLNTYLLDP